MGRVSLRAYNREIEDLIEHGQRLDEAVAHCRHILKTYPKHLETYRLLGKAYLEAKQYDQAVDVFRRVLIAAPEDFVAHVGMSIIADDQGKLDDAIWHMERAFEVQPSNAAIQVELQRLFGRRDGIEPPKIRLTRGALAHMYVQGALYPQAISEIRGILAHDQNRTDMQVLLARAYYKNGQKAQASESCSAVLVASPYCLEANRLMTEIAGGTQGGNAALEYRRRVNELDPYAEFAQGSLLSSDDVPDSSVMLQELEISAESPEAPAIGIAPRSGLGSEETNPEPPSWLASQPSGIGEIAAETPASENLPDFLREAGWNQMPTFASEPPMTQGEETEPAISPGDLPDWVRALAPQGETEEGRPAQKESWQEDDFKGFADRSAALNSSSLDESIDPEDAPEWLRTLAGESQRVAEVPLPSGDSGAVEFEDLSEKKSPADLSVEASTDQGDLAFTFQDLPEDESSERTVVSAPPPPFPSLVEGTRNGDARPEDRQGESTDAAALAPMEHAGEAAHDDGRAPVHSDEKSFDWLTGLADRNAFAAMEEETSTEQSGEAEESGAAIWPEVNRGSALGEEPTWLENEASGEIPPSAEREPAGEYRANVDLPAWLADLDNERAAAPAASESPQSERLPDWLQEIGSGESVEESPSSAIGGEWRPVEESLPSAQPEVVEEGTAGANVPADSTSNKEAQQAWSGSGELTESDLLPGAIRPAAQTLRIAIPSLSGARAEMGRGNIAAALDVYGRLIRKGRSLEEIIRDLRDALYRYPVEVSIWQTLGDAYMRANRLQEALDAYTKAEELLR